MKIKPKIEMVITDGWYPAEIGEVEERETKFGEKLLVPFEVDVGGDTIAIDAWLSERPPQEQPREVGEPTLRGPRVRHRRVCGPTLRGVRRGGRGLGTLPQELHPQAPAREEG